MTRREFLAGAVSSLLASKQVLGAKTVMDRPGEWLVRVEDNKLCRFLASRLDQTYSLSPKDLPGSRWLTPNTAVTRILQQPIRTAEAEVAQGMYRISLGDNFPLATEQGLFERACSDFAREGMVVSRNQAFLTLPPQVDQVQQFRQYHIPALRLPELWDRGVVDASLAPIVIMDTGVEQHPNLITNLDVHNSRVFCGLTDTDKVCHGTFIAGLCGALGYDGVHGVAGKARIVSVKVMDLVDILGQIVVSSTVASLLAGYYYLLNNHDVLSPNGLMVVVNAFGGWEDWPEIFSAITAGREIFLVVAASGTDGLLTSPFPGKYALRTDNVLCVGSFNRQGVLSRFSDMGRQVGRCTYGERKFST